MSDARVIITGAASGIGAAAVDKLRARGARVVGLDLNGSDEIVEHLDGLEAGGRLCGIDRGLHLVRVTVCQVRRVDAYRRRSELPRVTRVPIALRSKRVLTSKASDSAVPF